MESFSATSVIVSMSIYVLSLRSRDRLSKSRFEHVTNHAEDLLFGNRYLFRFFHLIDVVLRRILKVWHPRTALFDPFEDLILAPSNAAADM